LAGNALTKFVAGTEDPSRIEQIHHCLEASALAVLGEDATELVRITIRQQRFRWKETAEKWAERAELPPRRWNIRTSDDTAHGKAWVGDYERLAVAVMDAQGRMFEHPFPAADTLLDSLSEYLHQVKSPYSSDWAIRPLCIATAKYCSELRTRSVRDGNALRAEIFGELQRRFLELANDCGESDKDRRTGLYAYYRGIEDVTDSKSVGSQSTSDDASLRSALGPKVLVNRQRRLSKVRSYEKFAATIGISKDTLYAITNETRWVSDETYELVATACGCSPEALHPRDIPRPDRRRS
jgi:hypothetical protein